MQFFPATLQKSTEAQELSGSIKNYCIQLKEKKEKNLQNFLTNVGKKYYKTIESCVSKKKNLTKIFK